MSSSPVVPTTLDSFLSCLRGSNPVSSGDLSDWCVRCAEMLARTSTPTQLLSALDSLDSQAHALCAVLCAIVKIAGANQQVDWDLVYNRIVLFIGDCNRDQIRQVPVCFSEMCHLLTDELVKRGQAAMGLLPITRAINKLQNNHTSLTSIHSDLCRLALASKCFSPALKVLRLDFIDITKDAALDVKNILLYYYYGGMILAALKQFSRSLLFFEVCVTMPAIAVSHIMLEAYKKYHLVSLIEQGHKPKEALNLPKYTSSVVSKYIKPLSAPYQELVTAYYSNSAQALQSVVVKHRELFQNDHNLGLVEQVVTAQTKTNIKRLTKTFLTLSMEELAGRVGLASSSQAERLLVEMIEEGSIHARISQKDGMVRFDAKPGDRFNSVSVLKSLEDDVNGCIELDKQLVTMEEEIMLNATFVKKSHTAGPSQGSSSQGAGSADGAADGGKSGASNGFAPVSGTSVVSGSSDKNLAMF